MIDLAMPAVLSDHDIYRQSSPTNQTPVGLTAGDVEEAHRPQSQLERLVMVHLASSWVAAHLEPLRSLPPNWDSYGAVPVERRASDTAQRLVTQLLLQDVTPPQFFPTPDGGLSIEWHEPEGEFSIAIPPGAKDVGAASVYFVDEAAGIEWEEPYSSVVGNVEEILSRFVDRPDR